MTRRRVVVTERTLTKLWGYCYPGTGSVVVAKGLSERDRLGTLLHELVHVALPSTTEEGVERIAALLSRVLWRERYRRNPRRVAQHCVKDCSRGS